MGLREWLFKPYLERLQALEDEVKDLKENSHDVRNELQDILKALNEKADKDDLKDVRLRVNS